MVLAAKSLGSAESWLRKASFVFILTKPGEQIFQSARPILGHTALEGTLRGSPHGQTEY